MMVEGVAQVGERGQTLSGVARRKYKIKAKERGVNTLRGRTRQSLKLSAWRHCRRQGINNMVDMIGCDMIDGCQMEGVVILLLGKWHG